ncbi:hypothetical protein BCR36DRAFT_190379 [Piromyces finnis]|uniref:S-adenosyl-L-methionine-dependent methyltransferase n=1 Tax=Piromyces finnis TaxID=1754191 RepID=A0A1Y1USF5_9FUNG|nr:hypothetical protein BCR36DRAFT_190379 [Piromyces finnis]|eukprot:ORX40376.1 hypothetical protein BCR36DRAFT_190379 [Piromyces finnis]
MQILKKIINIIERNFCEINENLLNFYLSLLSDENHNNSVTVGYTSNVTPLIDKDKNDNTWWKVYSLDEKGRNTLRILEDKSMISKGTTGLRTWEASLRLSEYFIQNPKLCKGKNIIELGAGIGFLSLICAKLGAKSIISTDVNLNVIQRLYTNIESNKPSLIEENLTIPKVKKLDWNEKVLDINAYGDLNLIICADVIYNPENIEPLVNILSQFLKLIPTITIILCNPLRQKSTYDLFLKQLSQHNITIYKELIDKVPIIFCHDEEFSQIQMTIINKKD